MNEHEPTDPDGIDPDGIDQPESARLRATLQRAAAGVEVPPTPPMPDLATPDVASKASPARRFAPLLLAAAVVAVAGLGAWLLLGDDGSRRVDAGPAAPPVTVAPQVLEQSGIWRLPEGLDDYRLATAQENNIANTWSGDGPGALAVDNPADPERWLLVEQYRQFGAPPLDAQQHQLSAEVTALTVRSTADGGPIWFQVETVGGSPVGGVATIAVSGAVQGVDEAELIEALRAGFAAPGNLTVGEGYSSGVEMLTDAVGLGGGERIEWSGNESDDGERSMELTLIGPDDRPLGVGIVGAGETPAWAQALRFQLQADMTWIALESDSEWGFRYTATPRRDLGPNIVELSTQQQGGPARTSLLVHTEDGVMISVAGVGGALPDDIPLDEQLRIINSLRAMDEAEFRAQTERLGASTPEEQSSTTLGIDAPDLPG